MVSRIELDDTTESANRLFPMPKPALDQGNRSDQINVIRKTPLALLEFRQRPGIVPLPIIPVITKSQMSLRKVWVERERMIDGILGRRQPCRAWIVFEVTQTLRIGETRPSQNKIGIQLHCLLIRLDRTLRIGPLKKATRKCAATQIGIVGRGIVRGLGRHPRL